MYFNSILIVDTICILFIIWLLKGVCVMGLIKIVGHFAIMLLSLVYFGGLAKITYELGCSALDLHQKGMVSLGKWNRMLVGEGK
jgi:hypothetical protein